MDARRYDSMDAYMDIGGRATHGAVAEGIDTTTRKWEVQDHGWSKVEQCIRVGSP